MPDDEIAKKCRFRTGTGPNFSPMIYCNPITDGQFDATVCQALPQFVGQKNDNLPDFVQDQRREENSPPRRYMPVVTRMRVNRFSVYGIPGIQLG